MAWTIPLILVAIASAIVLLGARPVGVLFDRTNRLLALIARVRGASLATAFVLGSAAAALPTVVWEIPLPASHDDFAYLLAGDTYAHGRLTNPPHKLAVFFETFHVIQTPTYMAKFPMGQGLSLAIGFLLGLPIAGVWLTMGLACAAVTWMLEAVLSKRWALAGGLFAIVHPLTIWWGQSYSGGGVAMLGGAILGGALLRAANTPRYAWGASLAVGLVILANSRPLEGLITSIIALSWLGWRILRSGSLRAHVLSTTLPAAFVLAAAGAFMTYYNSRVTGDALTIPYVAHQRQCMVAPLLYYRPPRQTPPEYHHQAFFTFHNGIELNEYRRQVGSFDHAPSLRSIETKGTTVLTNGVNQLPIAVLLFGAILAAARRDRAARVGLIVSVLLPAIHFQVTPWFRPAYMAPAMPFLILACTIGMREISRRFRDAGTTIVRIIVITQILGAGVYAYSVNAVARLPHAVTRAGILAALEATPGKHLVLVRYGPRHSPLYDVVYNRADIDGSRVIWARSMGDAKDAELVEYFHDRDVVRLEFEENERNDFVVRRWTPGEWP